MSRLFLLLLLLASLPARAAEIVFTRIDAPARAVAGQPVRIEVEVANTGTLVLLGSVTVQLRVSVDRSWNPDADPFLCEHTFASGLGPQKSATARVTCTWPRNAVGTWYVVGEASVPLLQDGDPSDNRASDGPVLVVAADAPDLAGELPDPPERIRAGSVLEVSARVHNHGGTDARATTTRLLLSADEVPGAADVELCADATPPVPAGDHIDRTLTGCAVPADHPPGNAWLILEVDAPPAVEDEPDEADNHVAVPVRVLPAVADTETPPDDTGLGPSLDAHAPPRWFCRTGGEGGGVLLAALAWALRRRRAASMRRGEA